MSLFKKIDKSDIRHYETKLKSDLTLNNTSVESLKFESKSLNDGARRSSNAQYWDFFRGNFYKTGSYPGNSKLNYGQHDIGYSEQHKNKFHDKGRLISISQKYFDESIVPETFKFVDTNDQYSSSLNNTHCTIVDDGFGNLYSTNAVVSQSTNHASSSDNYVGNIYYDMGLVVFTETGSWSGSIDYVDDIGNGTFDVSFKSAHTLYSTEYSLNIEPNDFLHTSNPTSRGYISGSDSGSISRSPFYKTWLTGSLSSDGFTHFTTIGLYDMDEADLGPLIIARLPRAIKSHGKVPITLKLKLDKMII